MAGENRVQGRLTQIIAPCSRGCEPAAIPHDPRRIPMEFRKLSLAAALALAIGALGAGCAQETAPTATAEATAAEHTGHAGTPAQAHDHGHDHHLTVAAGMDFPVPDHHDKWAPDAPLIEGMSRVRDAIAGLDGVDDE